MLVKVDTDKLTQEVAEFTRVGFTPQVAVLYAIFQFPALVEAIIKGLKEGDKDVTSKSS